MSRAGIPLVAVIAMNFIPYPAVGLRRSVLCDGCQEHVSPSMIGEINPRHSRL